MKKTIALLLGVLISTSSHALVVANDYTEGCFEKEFQKRLSLTSLDQEQCMTEAYANNYEIQHHLAQYYLSTEHFHSFEAINSILKNSSAYTPKSMMIYPVRNYARILGTMYENGDKGAPMEVDAAEYLYKFAIKLGDVKSMKNLSELYSDSRSDLQSEWIEKYNQALTQ